MLNMCTRIAATLLMATTLLLAAACSNGSGGQDAIVPDLPGEDVYVPPEDAVEVVGDVDVVVATPVVKLEVLPFEYDPPLVEGCKCPAAGWCAAVEKDKQGMEIVVHATVENVPDGYSGITQVELSWMDGEGQNQTLDTKPNPSNSSLGEYELFLNLNVFELKVKPPEDKLDGLYELLVRVHTDIPDGTLPETTLTKSTKISILVDKTPPTVKISSPAAEAKFADKLSTAYCVTDPLPPELDGPGKGIGVRPKSVRFFLGDKEIQVEGDVPACTLGARELDVAQFETAMVDFRIEAEDCLGHKGEGVVSPTTVVGLPHYNVPSGDAIPAEVGKIIVSRAAHIRVSEDADDGAPDLVMFGPEGSSFALNDGTGKILPPTIALPRIEWDIWDGTVMDVNGDGATDIVLLGNREEGSSLLVHLQDVKLVWEHETDPVTQEKQYSITDYKPEGTFQVKPSEVYFLGGPLLHKLKTYDINGDGFLDLVAAGPEQSLSVALLLHTGQTVQFGHVPAYDGGKYLGDEPPAPEEPDRFTIHDKLQGISGIWDVRIGQYRHDGVVEGPPEIVVSRPSLGLITTILLDSDYSLGVGLDSLFCGGGSVTHLASRPDLSDPETDLYDDPDHAFLEDLVLYNVSDQALQLYPAKGNGYFENHFDTYKSLLFSPNGQNAPQSVCFWESTEVNEEFEGKQGFGQYAVSGTVPRILANGEGYSSGMLVTLGGEPDRVFLAHLLPSPPPDEGVTGDSLDLVVAVPEMNHIAFYRGVSFGGGWDGWFGESLFVNPGVNPHAMTLADLNSDGRMDIVVVVEEGDDKVETLVTLYGVDSNMGYEGVPWEIPLPPSVDWTSGRVSPTHFALADQDLDGDNDFVVATEPEIQYFVESEEDNVWDGNWDKEKMTSTGIPLILTYELEKGIPESIVPNKSTVDLAFNQPLSGLAVGRFNDDSYPDLAVTQKTSGETACDVRTFDILIGNRRVNGLNAAGDIGKAANKLHLYNFGIEPLYYRPMGGYLGLQNPTGLLATRLNLGDELDDIVLFGESYKEAGEPGFQPHQVATYITRYDDAWNACSLGTNQKQVYFKNAPYYPAQAVRVPVCNEGEPDMPKDEEDNDIYKCLPKFTEYEQYMSINASAGQALPTAKTVQWEAGESPVAGVTGEIYVAPGFSPCQDILVANKGTHDATVIRGNCDSTNYTFFDPVHLIAVGDNPVEIKVADLDLDGSVDVVAALGEEVSIMYGHGAEFFEPPVLLPKEEDDDLSPTSLVVEDVNDDGWPDLLVTSGSKSRIVVYLNGGEQDFLGPFELPTGINPAKILVAPIFRNIAPNPEDNCNDIAVLNKGSSTITLLRNLRCDD